MLGRKKSRRGFSHPRSSPHTQKIANLKELHPFQFRYAASQPPRLLQLDPQTLWFSSAGPPPACCARRKVEKDDVTEALTGIGELVRYNQLREQIMQRTECSKRTAQLAITEACQRAGSCRRTANTACRCRFRLAGWQSHLSARGRARADAQGRCDGAGSEEIG